MTTPDCTNPDKPPTPGPWSTWPRNIRTHNHTEALGNDGKTHAACRHAWSTHTHMLQQLQQLFPFGDSWSRSSVTLAAFSVSQDSAARVGERQDKGKEPASLPARTHPYFCNRKSQLHFFDFFFRGGSEETACHAFSTELRPLEQDETLRHSPKSLELWAVSRGREQK